MENDPQIHHRRSIRLKGYDYTQPGAYFVTICAYQREEIFGAVTKDGMQLSPLGKIVQAGRELNAANIWQRNYYEHIIRNENELKNFWNYIDTNPLRWQEDQLHPAALPNQFNQDTP